MKYIKSNYPVEEVIEKISTATGNTKFRISSELSGKVKGSEFRITFPPSGVSNLFRPVLVEMLLLAKQEVK